MRYIDSGSRSPEQALGYWLQQLDGVVELRVQTGFFQADALGALAGILKELRESDRLTRFLIGSNDSLTLAPHVHRLARMMGIPRTQARLGVVSFAGAYFHPKVLHYRLHTGDQGAYVGSANLTGPGIGALHVEAGLILDTREGDGAAPLDAIAAAIDLWFDGACPGYEEVPDPAAIDNLVKAGILAATPPVRTTTSHGSASGEHARPRLRPLVSLPRLEDRTEAGESAGDATSEPELPSPQRPVAPRSGFPDYILFDPKAKAPTSGPDALTGTTLPGGATGLIVRLSRDSGRHFFGGTGSSYISVPVPLVPTIRFGLYLQKYERPRAEFQIRLRLIGDEGSIEAPQATTNIMPYGVAKGERGHRDVRLLVPGVAKRLAEAGRDRGWQVPTEGDFALLEWPSAEEPVFRLSFLVPGSTLSTATASLYFEAERSHELMGRGACLLVPGMVPNW